MELVLHDSQIRFPSMFLILTYYFVYLCVRSASGWLLVLLIKQPQRAQNKNVILFKLVCIVIVILEHV